MRRIMSLPPWWKAHGLEPDLGFEPGNPTDMELDSVKMTWTSFASPMCSLFSVGSLHEDLPPLPAEHQGISKSVRNVEKQNEKVNKKLQD